MIAILRVDVAVVPVFVAPSGPRAPVVGMTFCVDRADETAATSGLSHLVEHLAGDSSSVRATGDAKLEVLVEEEWITLSDMGPAGKAREVEQLLRG